MFFAHCECLVTHKLGCTVVELDDYEGRAFRVSVRGIYHSASEVASAIDAGAQYKAKYLD